MISKYFIPTFFNGDKILKYLQIIDELEADLVISDYNINASFAAVMAGVKSVFVTERHNFTLVDVEIEDLLVGGFDVNQEEILSAQKDLNHLFKWLVKSTDLIITDKLFLDSFESDKFLKSNIGKVYFTGAMYFEREHLQPLDFEYLKIDKNSPYIVCTVSSTTMLSKNKENNFQFYIDSYKRLKKDIPDLQLVMLGNSDKPINDSGIVKLPYLPNWKELIQNSSILISHPGWITVTEAAYLNIPSLFYLSSFSEYHELEAYRRLEEIGIPVYSGNDVSELYNILKKILLGEVNYSKPYTRLSPTHDGIEEATGLIMELIEGKKNE
ncbi:hypothetical protein GYN67_00845 [Lactococcus piscium]|uniref:glycosyltransferase n=1 Tax=Pseudolactococcus carnosus TaxID=2749961 RepID=UPI001FB9A43F|nr:glycosyltransferase [Lactococcus carnosus]MCJ1995238.1 hypothetical protein [Lactococcus carnosus]